MRFTFAIQWHIRTHARTGVGRAQNAHLALFFLEQSATFLLRLMVSKQTVHSQLNHYTFKNLDMQRLFVWNIGFIF